jgi:hypothetical protein
MSPARIYSLAGFLNGFIFGPYVGAGTIDVFVIGSAACRCQIAWYRRFMNEV